MKARKLVMVLFLIALPGLVSAESGPEEQLEWEAGLAFGAAIGSSPDVLTDNFSSDSAFLVFMSRRLHGPFAVRIEFSHDEFGCDSEACAGVSGKARYARTSAGLQYSRDLGERVLGRGFLLFGNYDQELQIAIDNDPLQQIRLDLTDENHFGMAFGGGLTYLFSPGFGVGGDLHVHAVFRDADRDTVWYLAPTVHGIARF